MTPWRRNRSTRPVPIAAITIAVMGVILGTCFLGVSIMAAHLKPYRGELDQTGIALMAQQVYGGTGVLFWITQIATFAILILAAAQFVMVLDSSVMNVSISQIVADLDTRRHPFHVAVENWAHDLNIGSVVRTANAFAAAEVHIVGRRRWNRRGAMVTDRYQHVRHHPDAEALAAYLQERDVALLGIDNLPGSAHLETMHVPRRVCFLFGQEGPGLSASAREVCDATFSIAQFGSTRSINASAAAAIAMHSWVRTYADLAGKDSWRG